MSWMTKEQGENMETNQGRLYWITGLSGAGKTTIGTQLYYRLKQDHSNIVLLDGDMLKMMVDEVPGYTQEERLKRAYKYARICKGLVDQGLIVICCTIAMYEEVRQWNREHNEEYVEVFLDVPISILRARDKKDIYKNNEKNIVGIDMNVDLPKHPDVTLVNDGSLTVSECVDRIMKVEVNNTIKLTDDRAYWNTYYQKQKAPVEASTFASYIEKYLEPGKKLIDLGCGNGRDTRFFGTKDLSVIGVDNAVDSIKTLIENNEYDSVTYVADDFTTSKVLFQQNFDYCYSRFTMHAINKYQQNLLLHNVYESLCRGGYLFVEARTIHDEIYGKGEAVNGEENAFIYEKHYRRFIDKEAFINQLKELGFIIIEAIESNGLSKHGDSDPTLMRIVARK